MKRIFLLITLFICAIAGFSQKNTADMEQMRKLVMAHSAIANLYVDEVDEAKIVEASIKAMLKELDPHSTYLTAKEVEKMNEPLQGNFEGIGVQFNIVDDTLFVIQTVSKGPSEKVGILPGDRIVTVNDTAIAGVKMSREEIVKRLRGPKDSVVELGVVRRGNKEQLIFRVTRDKIPVNTLDAAYMIAPKVGYIKISSFGATTHEEFSKALAQLKEEKMVHLILDLQGNGGGYLKAAVDMANDFFDPYEEVLDTMYDALILAMTLGIDVSDTIMLLSDACNIWGKYLCDTCSYTQQNSIDSGEGICACNTTDNSGKGTNCYYRIRTENGKVAKDQPHCRLVGTVGNKEEVWHEWIDANSGITGTTQVACASDAIDNISIFRGRRKKTSVDIDTLRDFINQDAYGTCRTPKNPDDFNVLEDCGAKFCNVDPKNDTQRYKQLRQAFSTKKLPAQTLTGSAVNRLCFRDERDFNNLDGGGSSNNETNTIFERNAQRMYCGYYENETDCSKAPYDCIWNNKKCIPSIMAPITGLTLKKGDNIPTILPPKSITKVNAVPNVQEDLQSLTSYQECIEKATAAFKPNDPSATDNSASEAIDFCNEWYK